MVLPGGLGLAWGPEKQLSVGSERESPGQSRGEGSFGQCLNAGVPTALQHRQAGRDPPSSSCWPQLLDPAFPIERGHPWQGPVRRRRQDRAPSKATRRAIGRRGRAQSPGWSPSGGLAGTATPMPELFLQQVTCESASRIIFVCSFWQYFIFPPVAWLLCSGCHH